MTTIPAQMIGSRVLLARADLERLLELARRSETVEVQWQEDDLLTLGMMRLADQGKAFDFWREEGEDVYSARDGVPI